jgi:type IV pilus assembly protein PilP
MRLPSTPDSICTSQSSGPARALRTLAAALAVCVPLVGCGGGSDADLRSYVAEVKTRPGSPIEDLPPIAPYVVYTYPCDGVVACTDPFEPFFLEPPNPCATPDAPGCGPVAKGDGPSPDFDRNREELESFPLDSLRMRGTLEKGDQFWAILSDGPGANAIIHRVQVGNYIGQNHGKIIEITEDKIEVLEIIPDGRGGWEERNAELALAE